MENNRAPLYTRKGDDGKTEIQGGTRKDKDSARITATGTIDELNAILGVTTNYLEGDLLAEVKKIQNLLFEIGNELSSLNPKNEFTEDDVKYLEQLIDKAQTATPPLNQFILPGGTQAATWFHLARTVTRRAERRIVTLNNEDQINPYVKKWINRLSDLLFAWSRLANHQDNVDDVPWTKR